MQGRWAVMVAALVGTMAMAAAPARADQSPPGCTSNSLDVEIARDHVLVRNGDVVNYTVTVANDAGTACDVSDATIVLTLPAPDGTPTGQKVTLASGQSYPAGMVPHVIGVVPWVVALNPGIADAVVTVTAPSGVVHDAPTNHAAAIYKSLGTTVTQPHLTLTKSASRTSGQAPLTVTYTYTLVNDSSTPVPISNVSVVDDLCAPVAVVGGDANANGLVDNGESWTFACTTTHQLGGTYVDHASATGVSTFDTRAVTSTPASATVVASMPANCVSVPRTLSLRARELTTVRVAVTGPKGALVRVKGPGIERSGHTNESGVVTFHLRASGTGKLTISSNRCLNANEVVVHAARRTSARRVPRVTG
jgi:hypothetical protein